MIGRRVGTVAEVVEPGDYCGPVIGGAGEVEAMFFLLPIASDDAPAEARSLHHIAFPPHTYRECPDGSLEVRASIGALGRQGEAHVWHGYLDEGHVWRTA